MPFLPGYVLYVTFCAAMITLWLCVLGNREAAYKITSLPWLFSRFPLYRLKTLASLSKWGWFIIRVASEGLPSEGGACWRSRLARTRAPTLLPCLSIQIFPARNLGYLLRFFVLQSFEKYQRYLVRWLACLRNEFVLERKLLNYFPVIYGNTPVSRTNCHYLLSLKSNNESQTLVCFVK